MLAFAVRSRAGKDWQGVLGKATGIAAAWRMKPRGA